MRFRALCFAIPLAGMAFSLPAQAASEEECAIWLCAPAGFPGAAGCAMALAAMIDRLKDFDPPLPPFGECSSNGSDGGNDFNYGVAAYVPAHRTCSRYSYRGDGSYCSSYKDVAASHFHGRSCTTHHESGIRQPKGCTRTDRYVQVFINNQPPSDIFYFNLR